MRFKILVVAASAMALSACAHFKEVHYFKDKAGSPPNYYKLTVKGCTFLTSSRYLSGYFDEDAINLYFNEISQPAQGALTLNSSQKSTSQTPLPEGSVEPLVNKGINGRRFVMILSSNSDAVATQIGSFAENKQVLASLGRLINRDRIEAAAKSKGELDQQKLAAASFVALAEKLMAEAESAQTPQAKNQFLLELLNALAKELGSRERFASFDEAQKWYAQTIK